MSRIIRASALGGIALVFSTTVSLADEVAEFYEGRTVTIYVGTTAGGSYDLYARSLAPFLERYLPGNPSVIVSNMPGAASLNLVNQLNTVLPSDGTAIGAVARTVVVDKAVGRQGTENFDPAAFNWIGSTAADVSVCVVWHTHGIDSLEAFLSRELVMGGTAPGAETVIYPQLLNTYLGARLEVVTGYPGAVEIDVALEQGEVDARCGGTWSTLKTARADWLEQDLVYMPLLIAMERHPDLPDLPAISELVETDSQRQVLELILSQQVMGRPFVAPPGVPEDRVAALREAFDAIMEDPEFIAQVERQNLELSPIGGVEIQELVHTILSSAPEIAEAAREVLYPAGT